MNDQIGVKITSKENNNSLKVLKNYFCNGTLEIAGTHSKEVTNYFLTNLNLTRVEVDEIWSYIKKQKNVTEEDSEEYGDVYSLTALKSDTRLLLFHHEGKRSIEDAIELFAGIEKMWNASSPVPVFI